MVVVHARLVTYTVQCGVFEIRRYRTAGGREPFSEWLSGLRDRQAHARILVRLERLELGNFGDCKPVGGGVQELRIDWGPGYRVYFGQDGPVVVLLLCGGDKATQRRDIRQAKAYWKQYSKERDDGKA